MYVRSNFALGGQSHQSPKVLRFLPEIPWFLLGKPTNRRPQSSSQAGDERQQQEVAAGKIQAVYRGRQVREKAMERWGDGEMAMLSWGELGFLLGLWEEDGFWGFGVVGFSFGENLGRIWFEGILGLEAAGRQIQS